jgi:hypothetical protein
LPDVCLARYNNQNIQGAQKLNSENINKEMSKWTEQSFFKGRSPNVQKTKK